MAANDGFIDVLSPNALADLKAANAEVMGLIGNIDKANKALSGAKTPSSSNSAIKSLNDQITKQEAAVTKLQNTYLKAAQQQQAAAERTRLAEIKLAQQREKSVDNYTKAEQKAQAVLARSENYYNRIQASVSLLTKTYQDLALRKQLGSTLTANEERQLASLTTRINLYQTALKKVDADVQKHQRNVGNYASGYDGLGNSIAQLTREAPAFANSLQTGFMALSNNLPILFDEIARTKQGIAALKAEGKDAPSLFSQIAKSVFSLQTLLSVGVLLLTIYGDELVDWIGNLIKGSKAADTFAESQKAIAEATKEGAKNAQQELVALRANLEIARDVNLSYKDRMIAVENLQKTYPYYFENLTKEKILAGETAAAENALTEAILSRAKANAAIGKITENQGKIIDLEEKRVAVQERLAKAQKAVNDLGGQQTIGGRLDQQYDLQSSAANRLRRAQEELADINKEINEITAVNNRLTAYSLDQQKAAIGLDYNNPDSATKAAKAKREDADAIDMQTASYRSLIIEIENNISKIQELQRVNSRSYEEYLSYQKVIDELQRALKGLLEGQQELRDNATRGVGQLEHEIDLRKQQEERIKALQKATEDYISTIANSALGDLGMASLQQFFDGTFNQLFAGADTLKEKFAVTFNAIAEVAQEAFNFIAEADAARYDAMYSRLEKQKNISILFAGESATAREEIERQYEERRKAIQRQQAEAQRRQAVFNILVNTAQGVVSALAMTPPNVPLSIAIGVIGALQAGIVASTPIPQFYKGTENAPGGYAWVDERGPELHLDKHNRVKSTGEGKANLRLLAPGDKIKTAEETRNILTLNRMLYSSGVDPVAASNNGLSKADIKELLNGIPTADNITLIDNYNERGYNRYKREKGQTTQLMNGDLRLVNRTLKRG